MSNYQRTIDWLQACGKTPTPESLSVGVGCHIEEFCEFLRQLAPNSDGYTLLLKRTVEDLEWYATKLKRGEKQVYIPAERREAALDALCDCEVTGNGVAFFSGFNKPAGDEAVLASNEAKLINGQPVILPGGKIGKPPGWIAPDLAKFV